jgi:hypothetical protein
MKTLQFTLVAIFMAAIFFTGTFVSALDSNALSAFPVLSKEAVSPGSTVTIRINLQSNTDQQLLIQRIGVNFDWMAATDFAGVDLSASPITLSANGSYTSQPFIISVPLNATLGSHVYFVGIDGQEGTGQTAFSVDSSQFTVQVVSGSGQSTPTSSGNTPIPTATPTTGEPQNPLALLLYGTVIAIVAVIVVAVIFTLISKRRRKAATPAAEQPAKTNETQS